MKLRKILAVALCVSFAFALPVQAQGPWGTAAFQSWKQGVTAAGQMGVPRFATAALPTCNANNLSALAWDTTTSSLKVCNGSAFAALGGGGATTIAFNDDVAATWGTGTDSSILYDTVMTPDSMKIGVGQDSRQLWIAEANDSADYALAQQTNPTLLIHSAATTANQYIMFTHNQTNGFIDVGSGNIVIDAPVLYTAGGGGGQLTLQANTAQTPDTGSIATGTAGNSILIVEAADVATDFAHAQATNPTLYIQSADATQISQFTGYSFLGPHSSRNTVTVDGATTFAVTSAYIVLQCTGAETIQTITGGVAGMVLYIENSDTECTLDDDDSATASNAIDLTGTNTDDVGAVAKVVVLIYNGSHWLQVTESDN